MPAEAAEMAHSPLGRRKQPPESEMPFAKVEVAELEVTASVPVSSPPEKVEEAVLFVTVSVP
jgi:hypothetical protein